MAEPDLSSQLGGLVADFAGQANRLAKDLARFCKRARVLRRVREIQKERQSLGRGVMHQRVGSTKERQGSGRLVAIQCGCPGVTEQTPRTERELRIPAADLCAERVGLLEVVADNLVVGREVAVCTLEPV